MLDLLEVCEQSADLIVAVRDEPRVHLRHPGEQPLLIAGQALPRAGVVHQRERLSFRAAACFWAADRIERGQFGAGRYQTHLLLAVQDLRAHLLVPSVEAAPIPVGPLLRRLVRSVRTSGGVVEEHRPVRGDCLDIAEVLERPVSDVDTEVVTLLRGGRLLDRVIVVHQVRIPLAGLGPEESVEALETPADRPVPLRGGQVHLVLGAQMPLADHRGGKSLLDQDLGERRAFRGNVPVRAREPDRRLTDARHPVGGVVTSRQQAGSRRGAQGGGVPLPVPQPVRGDPVDVRVSIGPP